MIAPWPLERMCWRQFTASWGDCKTLKLCLKMWILLLLLSILALVLFPTNRLCFPSAPPVATPSFQWSFYCWAYLFVGSKNHVCIKSYKCCMYCKALWGCQLCYIHFTFHLGFVHPLQDVALHQCCPLSSVYCFPVPGSSLLYYVVLPSSIWSTPRSLPSPWLPLCAAYSPAVVHSCYISGPFPFLFQCVFYNVNYLCSFPDLWAATEKKKKKIVIIIIIPLKGAIWDLYNLLTVLWTVSNSYA